MSQSEVYYYYQEINPCQDACACDGEVGQWQVTVVADGVELSSQQVPCDSEGFRFAANGGAAVTVSLVPSWGDCVPAVREFVASEACAPVDGTVFGEMVIEKKHVLAE
jgi:hypothetical protein